MRQGWICFNAEHFWYRTVCDLALFCHFVQTSLFCLFTSWAAAVFFAFAWDKSFWILPFFVGVFFLGGKGIDGVL